MAGFFLWAFPDGQALHCNLLNLTGLKGFSLQSLTRSFKEIISSDGNYS